LCNAGPTVVEDRGQQPLFGLEMFDDLRFTGASLTGDQGGRRLFIASASK
jgi:hypothetical protein